MLQSHLSDQQFYCLLRWDLYQRFDCSVNRWYPPESNFAVGVQATILYNEFKKHAFEITATSRSGPGAKFSILHLAAFSYCSTARESKLWYIEYLSMLCKIYILVSFFQSKHISLTCNSHSKASCFQETCWTSVCWAEILCPPTLQSRVLTLFFQPNHKPQYRWHTNLHTDCVPLQGDQPLLGSWEIN